VRALWPLAIAWMCGCADKAQAPEPGIEATVIEVKPVEEPVTPPRPVETPKPVDTPAVAQPAPPPPAVKAAPPAPKHVPKAGSAAAPPPPDHKDPQLEQNPYLYK
jgi:hypothetical protein